MAYKEYVVDVSCGVLNRERGRVNCVGMSMSHMFFLCNGVNLDKCRMRIVGEWDMVSVLSVSVFSWHFEQRIWLSPVNRSYTHTCNILYLYCLSNQRKKYLRCWRRLADNRTR